MIQKNGRDLAKEIVRNFGAITRDQLVHLLCRMIECDEKTAEKDIYWLCIKKELFDDGDIIKSNPQNKIDREMIVAVWAFITAYDDTTSDMFFIASFPSKIGFLIEDEVFLITVCEDKYRDKNLISLREKAKDDVKHIIVGANLAYEDINPELLPPADDVIFIEMKFRNILRELPKIGIRSVNHGA